MIGQVPLAAEVAGAAAEAAAEEERPDAIGGHAGGELTGAAGGDRRDQPAGQIGAAWPAFCADAAEKGGNRRLDERSGLVHPVAAGQNADVAWLRERPGDHQRPVELLSLRLQAIKLDTVGDHAFRFGLLGLGPWRQHERRQLVFEGVDLGVEFGGPVAVERADDRHLGIPLRRQCVEVLAAEAPLLHVLLVVDVGEEAAERVEVFGRVGVVLVVVALGAAHRRPHPHARHIADPVGLVDRAILLQLQAPFMRRLQQPVVGTGQQRIVGVFIAGRANDVARQLQYGEPIERNVVEERLDYPVAVRRDAVVLIAVVADRVGIADEIKPPGRQPLGMPRGGEQPVYQ